MGFSARSGRRIAAGVIGAGAIIGSTLFGAIPSALADDPPNCTAADLAGVASGVSASTSAYLFTHPDVNAFFTGLKGLPRDQVHTKVQQYFDQNPGTKADMQGIRGPLTDIKARCGDALPPGPGGAPPR
jgi:hemophore-related protein